MMSALIHALPFVGIAFAYLAVFRLVFDRITPYDDRLLRKQHNKAARITRLGAYLGYLIALLGSLVMSTQSYGIDVMMFALDGAAALLVFAVAYRVIDFTILRRINNASEIVKGNLAVAKVEFCAYAMLGIIMNASFAGGGQSILAGMLSAALFSGVGLLTVVVVYTVYTAGWALRGCDLDKQILRGDQVAAINSGSLLLAFGAALWFSIVGDFVGWVEDLKSYGLAAALCIVSVSIGRFGAGILARKLASTPLSRAVLVAAASVLVGLGTGYVVFLS